MKNYVKPIAKLNCETKFEGVLLCSGGKPVFLPTCPKKRNKYNAGLDCACCKYYDFVLFGPDRCKIAHNHG